MEEDIGPQKKKRLSPEQALVRGRAWCAYQERCHSELRSKLYDWGLWTEAAEQVITQLISEGFVNEERFAIAYAGGKFRIKHWGRQKIKAALKRKDVSSPCIRKALASIDEADYLETIRTLVRKRMKEGGAMDPRQKKARVIRSLMAMGYESDLIRSVLQENDAG